MSFDLINQERKESNKNDDKMKLIYPKMTYSNKIQYLD